MSRGINKVILVGTMGKDPETRYMPNGGAVTNLSLATSESWKDKQTGDKKEQTEWHRVVLFNKLAEIGAEYLRKGQQVYIEGALRTRKWQDKDGKDQYSTEIVASDMQMIGGKREQHEEQQPQQQRQPSRPAPQSRPGVFEEDDIPF